MRSEAASGRQYGRSELTSQVVKLLSLSSSAPALKSFAARNALGTIDKYLFADMKAQGVTPADKTTDFEFARRVTLDLTGRIPTTQRLLSFVADSAADKRAKLIDELLAKPEWVDKWTMYFGDLYANTDRNTFVSAMSRAAMRSTSGSRIRLPPTSHITRWRPS